MFENINFCFAYGDMDKRFVNSCQMNTITEINIETVIQYDHIRSCVYCKQMNI